MHLGMELKFMMNGLKVPFSSSFIPQPFLATTSVLMPPSTSFVAAGPTPPPSSRRVAVIGAGASGLVAARELRREGHRVVVFERRAAAGGTWVYTPAAESDPLSVDPRREIVHTSLYDSLRTNLPRECMSFIDYPFSSCLSPAGGDPRRFPVHSEVLRYLQDFARDFDLYGLVRFQTKVERVERDRDGRWQVRSKRTGDPGEQSEVFDGVVVCNGHYSEPRIADIPGIHTWPGKQFHSHNYRVPEPFTDKVVVIIGNSASAFDISREIARYAREVHISSRSEPDEPSRKQPAYDNMWLHSTIAGTHKDGTVVFKDGSCIHVDVIMHCSGYKYDFPFLETNNIVTVDDNRVGPLYKHIFPPLLAPSLAFIGLPWKVAPFPLFELQSKWVAGVLSGRIAHPTVKEMMDDVKAWYSEIKAAGWPKRYTHNLSNNQFPYNNWLAEQCGHPPVEEWRQLMYVATSKNRIARPENYRDEWDDGHLIPLAEEDFQKFLGHVRLS